MFKKLHLAIYLDQTSGTEGTLVNFLLHWFPSNFFLDIASMSWTLQSDEKQSRMCFPNIFLLLTLHPFPRPSLVFICFQTILRDSAEVFFYLSHFDINSLVLIFHFTNWKLVTREV